MQKLVLNILGNFLVWSPVFICFPSISYGALSFEYKGREITSAEAFGPSTELRLKFDDSDLVKLQDSLPSLLDVDHFELDRDGVRLSWSTTWKPEVNQGKIALSVANTNPTRKLKNVFLTFISGNGPADDLNHAFIVRDSGAFNAELKSLDPINDFGFSPSPAGINNRYFVLAVFGESKPPRRVVSQGKDEAGTVSLVFPFDETGSIHIDQNIFFGPKEIVLLKSAGQRLIDSVDLGFFAIFARPLLFALRKIYEVVGNYGWAIVLLTILIKLITLPLTLKGASSMKKMAILQPEIEKIKQANKENPQQQQIELMKFMKSSGYNPLSGCLPILIQIPIFFALNKVLYTSVELYRAPFIGWIIDLSQRDPYYIYPVVMTLLMVVQQYLTPNTISDPAQKRMMQFMPLLFGVMMVSLPSGLSIYIITNSLFSVIQQLVVNRRTQVV